MAQYFRFRDCMRIGIYSYRCYFNATGINRGINPFFSNAYNLRLFRNSSSSLHSAELRLSTSHGRVINRKTNIGLCFHVPKNLNQNIRQFSGETSNDEETAAIERIASKFKESMILLDDARNSLGTVYFSEDLKEAEDVITDTLEEYNNLLKSLPDKNAREKVSQALGLKMNELKIQINMIKEMCREM